MNSAFGVAVVNEYGISDRASLLLRIGTLLDSILETQFIEIVDNDGSTVDIGEEGKILITDLHNKAMPFIR